MRCTDGEERFLGDFDAATREEASVMAVRWAGAGGALAWAAWDLLNVDTGHVVAQYSHAEGVVMVPPEQA